jgi:hypothetical protein
MTAFDRACCWGIGLFVIYMLAHITLAAARGLW